MSKTRRLKDIASRLKGGPVNPDVCRDEFETGVTRRQALPMPGGLRIHLRGDPVELVGAHRQTRTKRVGRVTRHGTAVVVPKRIREVVAVTVDGERVTFPPETWRLLTNQTWAGVAWR